jgi:SNF2 family DNA or RNA helicase
MVDTNKFIVKCRRPSSRAKKYDLHFDFNKEMIDCIKLLDPKNRSYKNKVWTLNVKGLYELITMFRGSDKIHFDFGSQEEKLRIKSQFDKVIEEKRETERKTIELTKNKKFWMEMKSEYEENFEKYSDKAHAGLLDHIKLYPHQIVGILFLKEVKNALLALDMGTGKSIISIGYVELMKYKKVLVITPNSLKFNYHNEVVKFTNSKSYIVGSNKNQYSIEESKYVIVNYDYFNSSDKNRALKKIDDLKLDDIEGVICDECQKLKNTKSNIYKNFNKFIGKLNISKVFMSGTPMNSRVYELYTILNQISPIEFSTKEHFFTHYCGMKYNLDGYGWEVDSAIKFDELYSKISPFMYRKRKEEVLDDLPDKSYINLDVEMTKKQQKEYDNIVNSTKMDFFGNKQNLNPLVILTELRKYLSEIKKNSIYDLINIIIENNDKVVIIDVYKKPLNEIHEKYKNISLLHTGDYSTELRADMVNKFQEKSKDKLIFLGTVSTTNYGLTLTESNIMILLTLPYTVGEYNQVVDRIYRIGQKNNVIIYCPIVKSSIDEHVFAMLMSKLGETTKILDNREIEINYQHEDINSIMKKIVLDIE